MYGRSRGVVLLIFAAVVAMLIGYGAYNLGMSHGLAVGGAAVAAPGTTVAPVVMYPYGWHRPWGFGFLFPMASLVFWFLVARAFLWSGGRWRRRGCYGGDRGDLSARFDQWHRESHERMKTDPSSF